MVWACDEQSGLSELPIDELRKRIWNCDETGFCTSVVTKKILARRGDKDVHDTLGGSGREYITVLEGWLCRWDSSTTICSLQREECLE